MDRARTRAALGLLALALALLTNGCAPNYYACRQGGGGRDICFDRSADFKSVARR